MNELISSDEKKKPQWRVLYNGALGCFKNDENNTPKIAAFDLDETIITTAGDNLFPINEEDWKFKYSKEIIIKKLKNLERQGFKLIILTNQMGISSKKNINITHSLVQRRIQNVLNEIGISSIQAFYAAKYDKFRKPEIGMLNYCIEYCNCDEGINLDLSFFVGDAGKFII